MKRPQTTMSHIARKVPFCNLQWKILMSGESRCVRTFTSTLKKNKMKKFSEKSYDSIASVVVTLFSNRGVWFPWRRKLIAPDAVKTSWWRWMFSVAGCGCANYSRKSSANSKTCTPKMHIVSTLKYHESCAVRLISNTNFPGRFPPPHYKHGDIMPEVLFPVMSYQFCHLL